MYSLQSNDCFATEESVSIVAAKTIFKHQPAIQVMNIRINLHLIKSGPDSNLHSILISHSKWIGFDSS